MICLCTFKSQKLHLVTNKNKNVNTKTPYFYEFCSQMIFHTLFNSFLNSVINSSYQQSAFPSIPFYLLILILVDKGKNLSIIKDSLFSAISGDEKDNNQIIPKIILIFIMPFLAIMDVNNVHLSQVI